MDFNGIKKKIFISLILGVVIVVTLGVYSDFKKIISSFLNFNYWYVPLILVLAPSNYFFRFIKWNYYLRLLHIRLDIKDNVRIFIAGLSMTVTPGKVGEFLKAYLIKEIKGIPISVTSPLIVIERLTDGISMIILASIGALRFKYGLGVLLVSAAFVVLFIVFVRYRPFAAFVINLLKKVPFVKKIGTQIDAFYQSSYQLLSVRSILLSVGIGVVSWSFEGIVIYLTLRGFNMDSSILVSIFTIAFSSIAGALCMLPGGLFVTEGSIMGLLTMAGISREIASATTIITRFATLWLGVLVGILGLISVQKRLNRQRCA